MLLLGHRVFSWTGVILIALKAHWIHIAGWQMLKVWNELGWMDGVGVLGSLLLCLAYAAVSNKWLPTDGMRFHAMNLVGALLLLASLYTRPNYGAIFIEVVWITIAGNALYRIFRDKQQRNQVEST